MNTWVCFLNLVIVCLFAKSVSATESAPILPVSICSIAQVKDDKGVDVNLLQHKFDDGAHDLAMYLPSRQIKRVTFGGSKAAKCHYKAMTLAVGGDWGWHLVWVADNDKVLNYVRMDGAAWVSSPTKKLSKNLVVANQPVILTFEQSVWVVWNTSDAGIHQIYATYSDDEGRSWNPAKLLIQTVVEVIQPKLVLKEGKPYLQWNEKVESLQLIQ